MHARQAVDTTSRHSTYTRNHLRIFRGASINPRPVKGVSPDRLYDVDLEDESAIFESPFHLHPPMPERNFLISPPGSPLVGWEQTQEEPPNEEPLAEGLQRALGGNRRTGTGKARKVPLAICPSILLIPEGEAGVCVRVQNWYHRRRVVVARDSEGWGALDEELSDGEWECELPSHLPPIRFGCSKGFKPAPASMPPPIIHTPTFSLHDLGGGLMFPSGTLMIQPPARPPPGA